MVKKNLVKSKLISKFLKRAQQFKRFDLDVLHFLEVKRALSMRIAYFFDERHPLQADEVLKPRTIGSILNKRI